MKTNKTEACPVAALADEAERLCDVWTDVEEASGTNEEEARHTSALSDIQDSIIDRASRECATSAKGALFQLSLASHLLFVLESEALDYKSEKEFSPREKPIQRLLRSVVNYIESTGEVRLKDTAGRHFLAAAD